MLIDKVLPQAVGGRATLYERFFAEAQERGVAEREAKNLLEWLPDPLAKAACFLDKMTGLWRYEFGIPFNVGPHLVWGTHMWLPVDELFSGLVAARNRLANGQLNDYVSRLADEKRHRETLVEMIPAEKVHPRVYMEFEVSGLGVGKRTVDWVIKARDGRLVLLDVKHRHADFILSMAADDNGNVAKAPNHDPALMFRSIAEKFVEAEPAQQLQGAWICTHIKQQKDLLENAFQSLDAARVHFAVLGDWKADGTVLARRSEDRQYLLDLFHLQQSDRFTFSP